MKKVISLLLALVMCLSLVACGGSAKETYHLGDTVSTDIFDFTLDEAAFAYALNNTKGENYFAPKEYDAEKDSDNPYVAPTGKTMIAITYTVTNTGRTTSQLYKGGLFTAKYDGKAYPSVPIGVLTLNASDKSDNVLVEAGASETNRGYAEIDVDVANLTDSFTITVQIPNSSGKTEKFTYSIG